MSAEQACGDNATTEVLAERLLPMAPSSSFTADETTATHVAVTFDPQFNPHDPGLIRSPSNLFVIDADSAPDVEESDPLGMPEDQRISITDLDDYRPIDVTPGTYRLYSRGSPKIRVIQCGTTSG